MNAGSCMLGTAGRVAVIWPYDDERAAIADALGNFNYTEIRQFASPGEFMAYSQRAEIDWILCGAFMLEPYSAISLLEDLRNESVNPLVKFSLFLDKSEESGCLDRAFELGLLSAHAAKFARLDLLSEFGLLNQLVIKFRGSHPLVAAHYARTYLNEAGKHESRLHLENALLKHIPFHPNVLFHLAEAEFVHGMQVDAVTHLRQAAVLAPELAHMAADLQARNLSPQQVAEINERVTNKDILGIKTAMIVDHDSSVAQMVTASLQAAGVKSIVSFHGGADALEWMRDHGPVDLLVTEWRLTGSVSGSGLVQRVRHRGFGKMKIMVVSSLLRQQDKDILSEVGVDAILPKPFAQSEFLESVVAIKMANFNSLSSGDLLRKIRFLLMSGNKDVAFDHINEFLSMPTADLGQKREVEALWAYYSGDYRSSVKLVSESLALGNCDAAALTLMGRALLKLRDYKTAVLFLERAQLISPQSIQRLLDLSEAQLGCDNLAGAKLAVEKAAKIDSENEWVIMSECRLAIEEGKTQVARGLLSELGSTSDICAQMNNRAIALAQVGKVSESIGIYMKTLDALPASWKTQIAKVTYNLGMAYARNDAYEKAEQVLASVESHESKELAQKANSLLERVKQARLNNSKVTFQVYNAEVVDLEKDSTGFEAYKLGKSRIGLHLHHKPGDICLYRIYVDVEAARNVDELSGDERFDELAEIARAS